MIKINYILLLIVIICLKPIICDINPLTTKIYANTTSIVYEFSTADDYFTSLKFITSTEFSLDFICELLPTTVRRCSADNISQSTMKKLNAGINNINRCLNSNCFLLSPLLYPIPIVSPDFIPSTKGGPSNIQGYYLKFHYLDFFQTYPDLNRASFTIPSDSIKFDPTNITLNYPSGCGSQQIKWFNNEIYNFRYANPTINTVQFKGNEINIIGDNFCDNSFPINISIDGVQLINSIITKDQTLVNFNHSQLYSKKSTINLITSNVTSVSKLIEFPPEPININSIPMNKGGIITLTGYRLSSGNSNSTILVKIGNLNCLNVKSISNKEIICNLNSIQGTSSKSKDIPVSVSIDGINNQNNLLFNYGIPFINPDYFLPKRVLNLTGNCFGNLSSTLVYFDGVETKLQDLIIDYDETRLSFKLNDQILRVNISIKVNGILSNTIQVESSFYVSDPSNLPSTFGSNINFTLSNINPLNFNQTAKIILPDGTSINGVENGPLTIKEKKSFSFSIPPGCGSKTITITIGNQTLKTSLNYQHPLISNCSIGNDEISVSCKGEFGNPLFYNDPTILFSNQLITPLTFINNSFSFPLEKIYQSGDLSFEICNSISNSIKLNISPSFDRIQTSFNTTGGEIYIIGKFLDTNTSVSVTCNNKPIESHFENSTTISFEILESGPNDLHCNYLFDNGKNSSEFNIIYPSPIIDKTNSIDLKGGQLSIIGSNFYNTSICKITIGNKIECQNITFINSTLITCILPPVSEYGIIENIFEYQYLNITFNNFKSSGNSNVFKYLKPNYNNSPNSSNNNENQKSNGNKTDNSLKLKISLPIVFGVLILASAAFISIYVINNKRKQNIKNRENEVQMNKIYQEERERDAINEKDIADQIARQKQCDEHLENLYKEELEAINFMNNLQNQQ